MRALHKLLSLGILFLVLCHATSAEEITVVYGADYKPFAWSNEQKAFGIQVDMVEEVLGKKMGLSIKHEACPWARCQLMVKQGLKDAFFTVPTEERKTYSLLTELPLYQTHFLMHTRKNNPKIHLFEQVQGLETLTSFPEIRHIFMLGSGWHDSKLSHMRIINRLKDATKIPLMLELGRADLYIEQEEMFRFQSRELGLEDNMLTFHSPVIQVMDWHLFIGKQSGKTHLLPQMNKLLAELTDSGELEQIKSQIFKKHGVD